MKDHNHHNGFKLTEIGWLPEEWRIVKLQAAFNFSYKPRNVDIKSYDKIPFIPMEYIPSEAIYSSKTEMKKPEEIRTGTFINEGDLLVAKITPSFENGKQCIIKDIANGFGYATSEVWPIQNTEISDTLFLFFYLKKSDVRKNIASKMEGSTGRQRIPRHVLSNLKIPLPPLAEQKKIAAVLSAVQEAREKTEAVIAAAKELKKSLMKYLFTYGPVPVTEANQVRLKETEIGVMPEEWEVIELNKIAIVEMGQSPPGNSYNLNRIGIPLINGPAEFGIKYPIPAKWTNKKTKVCNKNDIIFCVRGNTTGRMNIADSEYCIGRGVAAIRGLNKKSITAFLYYYFTKIQNKILSFATSGGSTFPNITKNQINNMKIPVPSLNMQEKISFIFENLQNKIEAEQAKKQALDQLFKSLLHHLMTGKVRVKDLEL